MSRAVNNQTVTVDVREDIRNGREPFSKIMQAAAGLKTNEELLLIAPFEPAPLFGVMKKQGFRFAARPMPTGDWEVVFTRESAPTLSTTNETRQPSPPVSNTARLVEVDARGLEPPQPLVKILETVATLPADTEVEARTDRRPIHLYPQLEQRGFTAETNELPDGSFLTHIRRA